MESSVPASNITPQASVGSSPATKCPMKTDLPMDLLINSRWQNDFIPTLLLWAGGNDDVWSMSHASVAYALLLMVDFHLDGLDSCMMDFSWHSPPLFYTFEMYILTAWDINRPINVCATGATTSLPLLLPSSWPFYSVLQVILRSETWPTCFSMDLVSCTRTLIQAAQRKPSTPISCSSSSMHCTYSMWLVHCSQSCAFNPQCITMRASLVYVALRFVHLTLNFHILIGYL